MTLETAVAKGAVDVTRKAVGLTESAMKKAWSLLDAASEKQRPGELLSQRGIQAMQGKVGSSG